MGGLFAVLSRTSPLIAGRRQHEGSGIRKENVQQMPRHQAPWRDSYYM